MDTRYYVICIRMIVRMFCEAFQLSDCWLARPYYDLCIMNKPMNLYEVTKRLGRNGSSYNDGGTVKCEEGGCITFQNDAIMKLVEILSHLNR